jgi:hypothetical protein
VPLANGQRLDTAHAGPHTLTVTASDAVGNTATASSTYTVDVTPPNIVITTPVANATYTIGTVLPASFACTDPGGSGVVSCVGSTPNGMPVDTSTTGNHTFSVTSVDATLNSSTVTLTYKVQPVQHLIPVVECVSNVTSSSYRAWFGYNNPNTIPITMAVGKSTNSFSPGAADRGQPTTFVPGRQVKVFSVLVSGTGNLTWTLDSTQVTAKSTGTRC